MAKRRRMNRWTVQLGRELDELHRQDPEAYEIGYALTHDFVRVQNGHWQKMEGGQGDKLLRRASPELDARARRMFRAILALLTTEFEQGPPSSPPPAPARAPPSPRRWRRRR